jgi:hypothetical protein
MQFTPLRTIANPSGPRWSDVLLSTDEAEAVLRRMAMVVGYDDRDGKSMVLGSGFLVGTQPNLIALTATHVLTEWADKVRPPAAHAFSDLHGDGDDLRKRLNQLIQANLIRVVVHSRPAGRYHLCKVGSLTVTANPRDIDVSCMVLIPPKGAAPSDFDSFAVDVDPYSWDEPVLMAGFIGGMWKPPEFEDEAFHLEQSFKVLAGHCRGLTKDPPRLRCPMYQLDMPSVAGMSGGPVLALRFPHGQPRIISPLAQIHATAIGIVSRDCIAPSILLDGSDPNETWAAPIEDAFLLRLGWKNTSVYFGDVVRDGGIRSYGRRALTATVFEQDQDHLAVRFDLPDV